MFWPFRFDVKVGDLLKFTTVAKNVGYCVVTSIDRNNDFMIVYWSKPYEHEDYGVKPYYHEVFFHSAEMFGHFEKVA